MALLLFCFAVVYVSSSASATIHNVVRVTDNPADQLVAVINGNRTAHKLSSLYDNPGLACIALQYIKAYEGDCAVVDGSDAKKPVDSQFTTTFAPNCGVAVSTLAPISGRLLGCQSKYATPSLAFSGILIKNNKSLTILYNNHTEVGAAVTSTGGGPPYFWCVLFSNGSRNGSFTFENGKPKISRPGCFSGADDICSRANSLLQNESLLFYALNALIAVAYCLLF